MIDAVVGIDSALTKSGVALLGRRDDGSIHGATYLLRTPANLKGHERMDYQRNEVMKLVRRAGHRSLVIIERAIPQRQAFALENLGLWWLITHTLWRNGIDYGQVVASSAKKYATGNGSAEKDEMLIAVMKNYEAVATVSGNDTADALVFAIMGAHRLGWPVPEVDWKSKTVPKNQAGSLAVMMWPEGVPSSP